MSDRDAVKAEDLTRGSLTQDPSSLFADKSYLSYLVPKETDLDLDQALKGCEKDASVLDSIEQRDALFFDETANILLVLKIPWLEKEELRAQISRLVVSLEAQVVNGIVPGRETPPAAETIFTGRVKDVDNPHIIAGEDGSDPDQGATQNIYAVWKVPVFLARPRLRPHNPSIVFSASASVRPEVARELRSQRAGYLRSGLPASFNLLESFSGDPALEGVKPRLSAVRVSRVAPVATQQDLMTHLRALGQLTLPIFPVLHARIRFSKPNTSPPSSAIVALLDLDFGSHFDCEVSLDDVKLFAPDASVESLSDDAAMRLPLRCVSHDHVTFVYLIKRHEFGVNPRLQMGNLDISIAASVHVVPGTCVPRLSLNWSAILDFSTPVNPNFSTSTDTGISRSRRPSQLTIGNGGGMTPLKSPSVTQPDALPALEASSNQTEASLPDLGITMCFTGPSEPIRPGEVFSWSVYVVNRSNEKATQPPRKLALIAIPRRRRNDVRHVRPPSTASRRRGEKEVADAAVDENVLHAMQKNSVVTSTDVICLSSDTRVGPLAPGACHVVELQFLALHEGVVGIEAIRVMDLGSQEHVDIKDLPIVVVEPATA
ncbi:hypothetical protein DCS_05202 [Drechmeria coniospora]|uniref:Trafficking protein particle complex II-specific subunit 65 IgD3 domain-containing protein n=1 Tax=Drechmeria coniospora TaxID=98403 RepID=A0A151GM56_DRECN|nr:hypothetical protein DCS_05202 [Drechmeria coniospora]KYK58189.1 hypothetical protein DCS_05202 [Drechmeria coniospora]ODA82977.1 hypothetical protein RJ55_01486 [Drechmeria coniospora]